MATRQMRGTRCPSEIEMRRDGVDEMDRMADAKGSRLEMSAGCRRMPADGVDGIDKMRDANWKRADEMESAD